MSRPADTMNNWLEERLGLDGFYGKFLRKAFPVHSSFFLGEIALFSFVILVLTGIYLMMLYNPWGGTVTVGGLTGPGAYLSVVTIDKLPFGQVMRYVHHWAAEVMLAAVFVHMARVFFTGVFKNPREINWLVGLGLLGMTVLEAFLGYSLPDDAFAQTATGIGYQIARSVPWLGDFIANLMFGGKFPALGFLPRLYSMHILLVPLALIGLISVHMLILLKQKHSQPRWAVKKLKDKREVMGVPLWPNQGLMSLALFFFLLGGLFIIASLFPAHPVERFGPPSGATPVVKPEWYLAWVFGLLRMTPVIDFWFLGAHWTSEFFAGVLFPGIFFLVLAAVPFIDRSPERVDIMESPLEHPVRSALGMAVATLLGVQVLLGFNSELGISVLTGQIMMVIVPLIVGLVVYYLLRGRTQAARARGR